MPRRQNTQMFALTAPPPDEVTIGGAAYRLVRVFKHDFFAATSLYEAVGEADAPRAVVKFYRKQQFCGLPMEWLGRLSRDHERRIYAILSDLPSVPRWLGDIGDAGCAIECIEGAPLDHFDPPPAGYFDRMLAVLEAVHACGVAYVDANKLSNMLVGPADEPFLIDFQISLTRRDNWPQPFRWIIGRIVEYLQDRDIYHLLKHKRRLAPDELTELELELSRRRTGWHAIHRKLTKPYRNIRRRWLARQHRRGRLVSPTAEMEDHHQPEKGKWRKD